MIKTNKKVKDGFATRLQEKRKEAGFTQATFAQEIFLTEKSYAKYETGNARPPYETLERISKILGVSIDYLLTGKILETDVVLAKKLSECPEEKRTYIIGIIDIFNEAFK